MSEKESEVVAGEIIERHCPGFGGIREAMVREEIALPSSFPSLDEESSWNTLPQGIPSQCRTALLIDVYEPLKVLDLLATALNHVGLNCKRTTNSVVFIVSVDRSIWDPAWKLYAPAFKGIKPLINIEVRYVGIPSDVLKSIRQILQTTTETRWLNKWDQSVSSWDEERVRRFCLAMYRLRNDAAYAGRVPKIIGKFTSPPYANQSILIFADLHPSNKAVAGTMDLRFKLDGTEYAKRIGYYQTKSIWQFVKI